MLTLAKLKSVLRYEPETGKFTWLVSGKGRNGTVGTVTNHGYLSITIEGKRYLGHRLAFLYMTGSWPLEETDHIDRNKLNNAWANLRDISHSQNIINTKQRNDNTSGQTGVCWNAQKMKWKVQISVKGGKRIQKNFVAFEDAVAFYKETAETLFPGHVPESSYRT